MVTPNRLLDLADGVGQVGLFFRYRVLDRSLNPAGTVKPLEPCSIKASTNRTMKRTLSGFRLGEKAAREINFFTDRIQPVVVLEDGTEWPCGVFVFTDAAVSRGSYTSTLGTTMVDQDYVLDQKTRYTFQVNPGGSITGAINFLLDTVGIFSRSIPSSQLVVPGTESLTFPVGTSRMEILTLLCVLGGWLPPFFDNNGVCIIKSPPLLNTGDPDHVYTDKRLANPIENDNLLTAPNVYVVLGTGPSKGDIYAVAQVDPRLPYSVENRGFEIVDVFRTQGMVSTEQAQQMANRRALAGSYGYKNVSFDSPIDPRHDLFQTIYYPAAQATFREIEFGFKLAAGSQMSHSITQGGFDA